jgi:hypothetical protein
VSATSGPTPGESTAFAVYCVAQLVFVVAVPFLMTHSARARAMFIVVALPLSVLVTFIASGEF